MNVSNTISPLTMSNHNVDRCGVPSLLIVATWRLFWDAMNCVTSSSVMRIISLRLLMFVKLTLKFWLRLNQFKVFIPKMRVFKVSSVNVLGMEASSFFALSEQISEQIMVRLSSLEDWGKADGHPGQYKHDVIADEIATPQLIAAGLGVVSEESGPAGLDKSFIAIIDPIDGSTNANLGLPWYALSICLVHNGEAIASFVKNLATGETFLAEIGSGAEKNGNKIRVSGVGDIEESIVVFNDLPTKHFGWRQYRALGSAALDLCKVADGSFDGFVDTGEGLAIWDYAGAALICKEAGANITDLESNPISYKLSGMKITQRRQLVCAGSDELHNTMLSLMSD